MIGAWLHIVVGAALGLAAWMGPRRVAGARFGRLPAVLLDLAPVALSTALLLIATARPIFAGVVVFALGAGFALADRTKREVLREPVVFSDMSELPHVFTHPQLYLPFAGPGLVVGGALAAVVVGVGLLVLVPPLWPPHPLIFLVLAIGLWAAGRALSREPALGVAADWLRRLEPSGDPLVDAARLGPVAMLLVHGVIARAERAERRADHVPLAAPFFGHAPARNSVPLVLVQCESFFDARRLSPAFPADLLPALDRCRRRGAVFGRFDVSGWGANTMRAEFAALTGIADDDLGYDRFNPYHAFARAPIASLAWALRREGYRTLCLHPFDRGFFRRDVTLPALGFETFLGRETLGGSRRPPYYGDPDLARRVIEAVDAEGPRLFVFAITMGNHGPWRPDGASVDPAVARLFDPEAVPQGGELLRYLDGLKRSDEMLQVLMEAIERRFPDTVLGFYGDHLPSLPHAFAHFGFDEGSSDYLLWRGVAPPGHPADLPAHRLPRLLLDTLAARGAIDTPAATAPIFADGAA